MAPTPVLPAALVDLTMRRLTMSSGTHVIRRLTRWPNASQCRKLHDANGLAAYAQRAAQAFVPMETRQHDLASSTSLDKARNKRRSKAIRTTEKLHELVGNLEETVHNQSSAFDALSYSDHQLSGFYEGVLKVDEPGKARQVTTPEERARLERVQEEEDLQSLQALASRLCGTDELNEASHKVILDKANEILDRAHAAIKKVGSAPSTTPISLSILSLRECEALVRRSLNKNDIEAAENALRIMKEDSMQIPHHCLSSVLRRYAVAGDSAKADAFLANFCTEVPSPILRHFHISAHLNATPMDTVPVSALDILHQYENQGVPAEMQTYTTVITSLFSRKSSLARNQAWDLFSHMRYVAHGTPDVVLYTLMIRACASPVSTRYSSEPEKALDLWHEMVVDNNIQPTVGSYNAIILACARSGNPQYINEGFRLARQMLDSNRDAQGNSPYRPDTKTFSALLEGVKRVGDLGRARWILTEMVKNSETQIDTQVMLHLFHCYAAYKPPVLRSVIQAEAKQHPNPVAAESTEADIPENDAAEATADVTDVRSPEPTPLTVVEDDPNPSFAHLPPQTHTAVISEVQALFNRILHDRSGCVDGQEDHGLSSLERQFYNVQLTPALLNAYLSVFYRHARIEDAHALYSTIFNEHGVKRAPSTYVSALEHCATAKLPEVRRLALKFAEEVWAGWEVLEEEGQISGRPVDARMVERAHVAMIRVLAISNETSRSLAHLRAFARKYPPPAVHTTVPRLHIQSTRTVLIGDKPLVRMSSAADVPDDHVPPLVTFRDVEVLHHRLVDEANVAGIKYVTWLCKAYEWALRNRRNDTIRLGNKRRDALAKTAPRIEQKKEAKEDLLAMLE